jgi:hypothetical protein
MTAPGSYRRKKGLGITVMAGLAFASVGLAAPAQADMNQDQDFYRYLTEPDQDHPMVIFNFPLVRSQGIASCQREDAGATPMQSTYYLDRRYGGPYTFNDANNISSSADTVYCPWHQVGLSTPGWVDTPSPISWRAVYPPLAWYPAPGYYPPPPGYYPPPGAGSNF